MKVYSFDLNSERVNDFINLQDAYFTDELFVPTPKEQLQAILSTHNPFFSLSKYQFFILEDQGKPIARALAAIDSRREQEEAQLIGNIGYFESPNNQDIANTILSSCREWLKSEGATEIHGPMDLHIYNNYRFMTDGFETSPFLSEPRNPRYYPELFEGFGLKEVAYWRSWQIEKKELSKFHSFVDSIVTRRKNLHSIKITPIDIANIETSLAELYDTALEIFSQNYSYSEISKEEFIMIFSKLKTFLAPESFQVARNSDNKIVGFVYGLIDPFHPNRYIYHTFGVIKDLRFSDITARLSHSQTTHFANDYEESIAALTTSQKSIIERIKKPNRYYKMYELKI